MSKTAHAPGPWRVEEDHRTDHGREYLAGYDIVSETREIVGCEGIIPGAEAEANARLIAAAPELLEALQSVNKLISEAAMTCFNWQDGDWTERLYFSQQATSRAIRKATGPA